MSRFDFPNLEEHGWALDDGEVAHRAHPDTYQIPPYEERSTLKEGDCAKIRFLLRVQHKGEVMDTAERMWVEVMGFQGDYYLGKLVNDPVMTDSIAWGQPLFFEARHVTDIIRKDDADS